MSTSTQIALTSAPTTEAVARMGSETQYAELHVRRLGNLFELRVDYVEYVAATGRYVRDMLKSEILDDAEDAISEADDMAYVAARHLAAMDARREDWLPNEAGFGEAVADLFPAEAPIPVAAE